MTLEQQHFAQPEFLDGSLRPKQLRKKAIGLGRLSTAELRDMASLEDHEYGVAVYMRFEDPIVTVGLDIENEPTTSAYFSKSDVRIRHGIDGPVPVPIVWQNGCVTMPAFGLITEVPETHWRIFDKLFRVV